jgi:hypothetical protein
MADTYAWSDIWAGGETEQRQASGNRLINVVMKRNITKHGSKVTQKDLGVSKEEWEALLENGVIRDYPPPEGTDDYTSPTQAFMRAIVDETGEVDVNKVMELGLQNPGVVLPEVAGKAAETPKGA